MTPYPVVNHPSTIHDVTVKTYRWHRHLNLLKKPKSGSVPRLNPSNSYSFLHLISLNLFFDPFLFKISPFFCFNFQYFWFENVILVWLLIRQWRGDFFSFSLDSVFNFFSLIYGDHIILARCQRSLGSGDDGLDKSDFFIFEKENIRASDEENDSSAVDQLKTSIFLVRWKSSKVNFKCENLSWQEIFGADKIFRLDVIFVDTYTFWWIYKSYFLVMRSSSISFNE